MTEDELVNAYTEGHISRRVFIRRLIQGGIGASAAFAYAEMLASPASASNRFGNQGPRPGHNQGPGGNGQNNPGKGGQDCGPPDHRGDHHSSW